MAKRIENVFDLTPKVEDYTITNTESGEEYVLALRPLTPSEVSQINASIKHPKPKTIGFSGKDELGRPIPVYDDESPEYLLAQAKANQDFVYSWLLASWAIEIPGETHEEKLEVLRKNIPNWVFVVIQEKLQEIQGYRMSDVAYAKKKSRTTEPAS